MISKAYIKYFIMLLPFLLSSTVFTMISPMFANSLMAIKIVIFFLLILKVFMSEKKINKLTFGILIYFIIYLISVIINSSSISDYVKEVYFIFSYMLIIEYAYIRKENQKMITAFNHILFILLFLNISSFFLFPEGIINTFSSYGVYTKYFFLGLENQITPILILSIFIYFLNNKHNFMSKLYFILIIGNTLAMGSATGIAAIAFIIILSLFVKNNWKINNKIIIAIPVLIFLFFVLFRVQNLFSGIIENVLHKDLTFSSRIFIWDNAIEMIKIKPILGYGCETMETIVNTRNAHNAFLQVILQSGLVGFCSFVYFIGIGLKKIMNKKQKNYMLMIICTSAYFISCIFEVFKLSWLIIFIAFDYYTVYLEQGLEKRQ